MQTSYFGRESGGYCAPIGKNALTAPYSSVTPAGVWRGICAKLALISADALRPSRTAPSRAF
jgi:hypothetical protein